MSAIQPNPVRPEPVERPGLRRDDAADRGLGAHPL